MRKAAAKKVPLDIKAEFAAIESRSFFAMMRCCGREEANAKRLEMQMAAEGRDSRRMRALRSLFEQVGHYYRHDCLGSVSFWVRFNSRTLLVVLRSAPSS